MDRWHPTEESPRKKRRLDLCDVLRALPQMHGAHSPSLVFDGRAPLLQCVPPAPALCTHINAQLKCHLLCEALPGIMGQINYGFFALPSPTLSLYQSLQLISFCLTVQRLLASLHTVHAEGQGP